MKSNQTSDFMKIYPVGAELFRVDGQTDYSTIEFEEHVTTGLIHISQIGNKRLIYIYIS